MGSSCGCRELGRAAAAVVTLRRRTLLVRLAAACAGAGAAALASRSSVSVQAAPAPIHEIPQPQTPSRDAFIARAFEMRRRAVDAGDQSYGAIIVKDSRIVGLGPSRVITNGDPTAHAEMEAIRDAARRLGSRDLSGCVMYSTSRPCRMCESAAYWANVTRLHHGPSGTDAGAPRYGGC
ncbi:MAG: nucleoside deaminase [Armatimonadota bacterium]